MTASSSSRGAATPSWLDVQTVALVMGVSKWTIYRAIKRGEIPFVRIALTAYACCRVAGEADRMEGLHR